MIDFSAVIPSQCSAPQSAGGRDVAPVGHGSQRVQLLEKEQICRKEESRHDRERECCAIILKEFPKGNWHPQ